MVTTIQIDHCELKIHSFEQKNEILIDDYFVIPTEHSDEESHNFEFEMSLLTAFEMTKCL